MPSFLKFPWLSNTQQAKRAIDRAKERIDRYEREGRSTPDLIQYYRGILSDFDETFERLKKRDPKDSEVVKELNNLGLVVQQLMKDFEGLSREAMKNRGKTMHTEDFTESSAAQAGPSHQSQHCGSRHNLHQPPSLQRFSFEESHMQEQAHTNPAELNRHILSPQELRGTAGGSHEQNLQKSSNVQSQSTQSGKRKEDNTSDGRDDPVQRFPYGHRTRDSVNAFGIPHQASRINPTASSTGHAGQSTESFSSSRTPSSNYTYDGRQSEGSSSRQGSTRSRRSQNPSYSGRGGSHYNLGPVPQTSYPAQSVNYPSQPGPSQMQVPPSPYYPQPGPSSSTSGPSGYPGYPAYPQGPTQAGPFVPDDDEDLYDPGYSMPKAGPPPGQGRGRRGGHR